MSQLTSLIRKNAIGAQVLDGMKAAGVSDAIHKTGVAVVNDLEDGASVSIPTAGNLVQASFNKVAATHLGPGAQIAEEGFSMFLNAFESFLLSHLHHEPSAGS